MGEKIQSLDGPVTVLRTLQPALRCPAVPGYEGCANPQPTEATTGQCQTPDEYTWSLNIVSEF